LGVSLDAGCGVWWPGGVYVRESRRTNRDGSVVRYLQLAHNERHPDTGNPVAKVIHGFGRVEGVDRRRWPGW